MLIRVNIVDVSGCLYPMISYDFCIPSILWAGEHLWNRGAQAAGHRAHRQAGGLQAQPCDISGGTSLGGLGWLGWLVELFWLVKYTVKLL